MALKSDTRQSGIMKRLIVASLLSASFAAGARAESPVGEWLVEDGTARIRIVQCGNALWGVISWTKDAPGKDENNPDPALRNRSVIGIPILINMKRAGQRWEGEVYNAENGKTYTARIGLERPDVLNIEGCVFGGIFCGGESWKRVAAAAKPAQPDQAVCSGVGARS
jgi:uncharacterized protein (DUF2147 family)